MDDTNVLGINIGESLRGFISETIKEGGIMGTLLSILAKLFFGSNFLENIDNKKGKATENLKKFIKKADKGIFNSFEEKNVENLKPKNLEKFYKFLDGKKIDYSKSDFWEKLTTGKVDGELLKIYNLLTDNGKVKGILTGDELKGNKVQNFAKKLNGIPDIFEKKEIEENDNEITKLKNERDKLDKKTEVKAKTNSTKQEVETPAIITKSEIVTASVMATTVAPEKIIEKKPITNKTEVKVIAEKETVEKNKLIEKEKQKKKDKLNKKIIKLEFEQSINKLTIPGTISHPKTGEKLNIKIEGKNIKLGKDIYGISIIAMGKENFEKIEFIDGNIILNGNEKNPINKNQIKELIIKLLNGEEFNYSGKTKVLFSEIDYKLNIKKK
ncbi:MAG: hypothetical protein Q9M97_00110 [Candidatus Gracilibacteria bacterium]|nr:hypothetical protein [Candidatus Gracilibacteria bacterium]